ncbi:hypothetical protein HYX14_06070 [Candidatus Woesearchaeota archaeon]|nr:hypothetical protein [Candidatus Woesearchaeota archaeon]
MEKRAQAAGGAAVLLAVIAGLIVMFIILIPPTERARLLEDESQAIPSSTVQTAVPAVNLLKESPGRLDYLPQKEIEHPLPVVNIYTKKETKVLAEKNTAYAKKGAFSEEVSELTFPIADVTNTDTVLLAANIKSLSGRLIITFNGEEIFNDVVAGSFSPVKVPKSQLQAENKVLFAVASPGAAFWRTNEASLENVRIIGDVTNTQAQSSQSTFLISDLEKTNLERVTLEFQPSCQYTEVGVLTITLNGKVLYQAVPDCDLALVPLEIASDALNKGENEIIFAAGKGTYILSHLIITSKLKEVEYPTYYFELSNEQYQDIKQQNKRARVQLDFVDVIESKMGDVLINGKLQSFDTKESAYTIDVGDEVVLGNNAIKIKPKKTLEIRELRVDLLK